MPDFDPATETLTLNQNRLHFIRAGAGHPVILIHGSLCDYRYWRWQWPAFTEQYRVVAPSLFGYWPETLDTPDDGFTVARHAADVATLMHTVFPEQKVHVLGHSRGAHVALEAALAAPEHIASLVLADPGFHLPGLGSGSRFQLQAAGLLANGEIDAGLEVFIDAVSGPDTWRRMTGWFKTMVRDNAMTLLSQINESEHAFDLARARQIECPVLLLGGTGSPPRYKTIQDALEPELKHAVRDQIPLASHGMNLANPKAFNRRVLSFWAQHEVEAGQAA